MRLNVGVGITLLVALGCLCSGCTFFGGRNEASLAGSPDPTLDPQRVDALELEQVREVFGPGERPSKVPLDERDSPTNSIAGGQLAYTRNESIGVRVYEDKVGAIAALNARLRARGVDHELGPKSAGIPFAWWYRRSAPATAWYVYGNTFVMITMATTAPDQAPRRLEEAVRAVAQRILRVSRNLPASD